MIAQKAGEVSAVKILFLSGWFPYPPDNGARMRTFNLLKHLSVRHEITLLSFVRDGQADQYRSAIRSYCQVVKTVPFQPFRPHHLRTVAGFLSAKPRVLVDTYSHRMRDLVTCTLEQEPFDVVIASEIGPGTCTTPYVRNIKAIPRILEDLELSMIESKIKAHHTWSGRMRHRLTWWKLQRFAARLLRDMDGCTVASEREQKTVLSIVPGYRPLAVVPNGVDADHYAGDFGTPQPNTLVFQGALTYRANFDAMAFFLGQVFPLIRAERPEVKLYITGRTEGVPLERLPRIEGVVFTGYLEDVRPRVARSMVCVVPLTVGGGTRLKILEAMALGTPVVSTSKGAEGLEVTSEHDILIADEPAAFAEAVLRLLSDRELRNRLAKNGRRLVREKYDWNTIGAAFDAFLREVVAAKSQTSARTGRQG